MNLVYLIMVVSVIFNLVVIRYDFFPFYYPKIRRKLFPRMSLKRKTGRLKELVIAASFETITQRKNLMVWKDHRGVAERLFDLANSRGVKSFRKYNYPHAFLLYGLIKSVCMDKKHTQIFKEYFDRLLDKKGNFVFTVDKVDQASYGLVALELYKIYEQDKYKNLADSMWEFIFDNYKSNNGFVLYRKGQLVWLNDMIGLVLPFLIKYYECTNNKVCLAVAREQLEYYIKYGTDTETYMPAHGINLINNVKTGSINWGRGIGWYFLGLKEFYELDGSFEKEYLCLTNTLMKLKNKDGLWSHFPGSSDYFDASSTTMFLYCMPKELHTIEDVLTKMDRYISKNGYVLQTSGDTYGANSYSKTFGKSELTQGMMLLLLSRYK